LSIYFLPEIPKNNSDNSLSGLRKREIRVSVVCLFSFILLPRKKDEEVLFRYFKNLPLLVYSKTLKYR